MMQWEGLRQDFMLVLFFSQCSQANCHPSQLTNNFTLLQGVTIVLLSFLQGGPGVFVLAQQPQIWVLFVLLSVVCVEAPGWDLCKTSCVIHFKWCQGQMFATGFAAAHSSQRSILQCLSWSPGRGVKLWLLMNHVSLQQHWWMIKDKQGIINETSVLEYFSVSPMRTGEPVSKLVCSLLFLHLHGLKGSR